MLNNMQIELIKKIDNFTINSKNGKMVKFPNEGITGFMNAHKSYFYKNFESYNGNYYVYNTVTNTVESINTEQKALLENPQNDIDFLIPFNNKKLKLKNLVKKDGDVNSFKIRNLLINTTEQCNLRCTYCYFGGEYDETRIHNNSKITFLEIKPLIDKFLTHQENLNKSQRSIYFFGGEPLINFKLIQETVEYVNTYSKIQNIDISNLIFQVASNATLLNEKMADFLERYNIHLNVSMDGPNHDNYRLDMSGKGSLNKVTQKLEWLQENYPIYYSNYVGIACVVTPPYNIKELYDFFTNWAPAKHALHIGFDLILFNMALTKDKDSLIKAKEELWNVYVDTHKYNDSERDNSWLYFFTSGFNFLHQAFSKVLWRGETDLNKDDFIPLNGIKGLPGLYISALSTNKTIYSTFEYQSPNYKIGNLEQGLDNDLVNNMIDNLHQANNSGSCTTCWAARLCKLDYPDFYISEEDNDEIIKAKIKMKNHRCEVERKDISMALAAIESIKENNGKEALNYMEKQKMLYKNNTINDPWLPYKHEVKI